MHSPSRIALAVVDVRTIGRKRSTELIARLRPEILSDWGGNTAPREERQSSLGTAIDDRLAIRGPKRAGLGARIGREPIANSASEIVDPQVRAPGLGRIDTDHRPFSIRRDRDVAKQSLLVNNAFGPCTIG